MTDVLVPFAVESLNPPDKLEVHVWDGLGDTPEDDLSSVDESGIPEQSILDRVEYFVLPYSFAPAAMELIARMPRLRAVQT